MGISHFVNSLSVGLNGGNIRTPTPSGDMGNIRIEGC